MNTCLQRHAEQEALEEYTLNRLSAEQCSWFEEHLLVCCTCQDHLAAMDEYIQVVKAASALDRDERSNWPAAILWMLQNTRRLKRSMVNLAVSATAITAITPACTGSVTTRSAASGTLPAILRLMTKSP